ncbi:MAG: ABC transporter permease [Propionibacterium sp.]|nr:ABC transporter permease [Propionibacterium sp.]
MRAMIAKEFRELTRDHRTLAMTIVLPILLLVVFGYAANFNVEHVTTALIGDKTAAAAERLPDFFDVTEELVGSDLEELLRSDQVDVVIDTSTMPMTAYLDGSALFAAQSAQVVAGQSGGLLDTKILFNPDLTTSWVLVPAIAGLIMALIGTIITSIGLVREKEAGTIEQLAVLPIRPSAVIIGKIAPYFVLAVADITVVTLLGLWLFAVPFNGPAWVYALGAAFFLLVVLGFGVLASTLSATTGQAIQTAMFFMFPQILLSGMVFPLEAMPWGVRWIGYILPLTYFIKIAHGVLLRGAGFFDLWLSLLILAAMATVILSAAILRFGRSLAPRQPRVSHRIASEHDHARKAV